MIYEIISYRSNRKKQTIKHSRWTDDHGGRTTIRIWTGGRSFRLKVSDCRDGIKGRQNGARQAHAELRTMANEGYLPIRVLAQIGGLAMIVLSIIGFINAIIHLNFLDALVEVYTFLLGIVVIILETKAFPKSVEQSLNKYALFLTFVWGRGCLYFVAGSLQATQVWTCMSLMVDICIHCCRNVTLSHLIPSHTL